MYKKLLEQFIEEQEEAGNFGGYVGPEVRRHIMYFVEWLEAAQLQLDLDLLPCGHHKDAVVSNGVTQWCVACEHANRSTS